MSETHTKRLRQALCVLALMTSSVIALPARAQEDWPPPAATRHGVLTAGQVQRIESDGALAYLVLQQGGLVAEFYFGRGAQFRTEPANSIAKSVVLLLLGAAIGERRVASLDDRAARYLPTLSTDGRDRISLRHLAGMNSGLAWQEARDMVPVLKGGVALERYLGRFRLETEPGTRWNYSSGDFFLLGMALERATGRSLSAYAAERLWEPLGLGGPGRAPAWAMDTEGRNTLSACCLHMRPRDFARLGQLVLQQGRWNGKQLLPRAFIDEASRARVRFGSGPQLLFDGYGYGLAHFARSGLEGVAMLGEQGQAVFIVPALDLVVVRLGTRGDAPELSFALDAAMSIAAPAAR